MVASPNSSVCGCGITKLFPQCQLQWRWGHCSPNYLDCLRESDGGDGVTSRPEQACFSRSCWRDPARHKIWYWRRSQLGSGTVSREYYRRRCLPCPRTISCYALKDTPIQGVSHRNQVFLTAAACPCPANQSPCDISRHPRDHPTPPSRGGNSGLF